MKVVCIPDKMPHFGAHSGYNLLARYVRCTALDKKEAGRMRDFVEAWPQDLADAWLDREGEGWYRERRYVAQELLVAFSMLRGQKALYHFLFGENAFRWAGLLPGKRAGRVVASFHQPPEVFERLFKGRDFAGTADAVVVVGTNQIAFFENMLGKGRVFFVPHGVDTRFFCPGKKRFPQKPLQALCVGAWLRDGDTLLRAVTESGRRSLGIQFDIVGPPDFCGRFKQEPNARVCSGISDQDLRQKYREADALLLPLSDATASNSILEAMACGTPVVTTRVGGVRDYVDEASGVLVGAGDHEALLDAFLNLAGDPEKKSLMGRAARRRAETFSWKNVGRRMTEVYRETWKRP